MQHNTTDRQPRKLRCTAVLLVGLLALATSAACSSDGDDDGVASGGGSTSTATDGASISPAGYRDLFVSYAKCMRDNGIDDFPDPDFTETEADDPYVNRLKKAGIERDTQDFKAAEKACADIMASINAQIQPGGALYEQNYQDLLEHSECMRDNGVEDYQDPQKQSDGIGIFETKTAVDDPDYKAAQKACAKHLPDVVPGGEE